MTSVILLDWLGRGGIPQTTEAWRRTAREADLEPVVISRRGVDLQPDFAVDVRLPTRLGAIEAHRRLADLAAATIRELQPDVVYVQHYWLPFVEARAVRAARDVGSRVILAIHNHRPHARGAGTTVGLRRYLRMVDEIVVHSRYVGGLLGPTTDRHVTHIELPLPLGLLDAARVEVPGAGRGAPSRAIQFGVLKRRYKGRDWVRLIAEHTTSDWEFLAAGVGAGRSSGRLRAFDRFLAPEELVWFVESSDVALLPYSAASQSAAVILAQALGVPPVASDVGGISEQIEHGRTGILMAAGAPIEDWVAVLERLAADPDWLEALAQRAVCASRQAHARAVEAWLGLVA